MTRRGVPQIVAQRIAGHTSPLITSRHYVQTELDDLRGAVEGVSEPRRGRGVVA